MNKIKNESHDTKILNFYLSAIRKIAQALLLLQSEIKFKHYG